jgi:hypothetical protein
MEKGRMEKASDGSFPRTTRKTAEDYKDEEEDEKDWDRTLNRYGSGERHRLTYT